MVSFLTLRSYCRSLYIVTPETLLTVSGVLYMRDIMRHHRDNCIFGKVACKLQPNDQPHCGKKHQLQNLNQQAQVGHISVPPWEG
jgi:hypothetical protein